MVFRFPVFRLSFDSAHAPRSHPRFTTNTLIFPHSFALAIAELRHLGTIGGLSLTEASLWKPCRYDEVQAGIIE